MFSFKINKLSTTDNILNGKPCNILYTGYINKDISFGDIIYFEPTYVQYEKLVNGVIDQLKVSLIDRDGNKILSNFKISIVLHIIQKDLQLHNINIALYYTDKYALWLDFRTIDDNILMDWADD